MDYPHTGGTMSKFLWTVCTAYWLHRYGYASTVIGAYRYAKDDCWQEMRDDGFTPKDAVLEDLSCAD